MYEMCVLFFKMAGDLRTWDANCEDLLCHSILGHLVDSGLPIGTSFLPPHKSTRYHVQEFNSSGRQITSKKELYNYRHSSLRMVIERSFGVLKARFPILNNMPNLKPIRQRYVVIVCCALHNFIRMNNRSDELFRTIRESDGCSCRCR